MNTVALKQRLPHGLMIAGLLVWLAVSLPSLAVYPYPYPDDAWIAAPAENFRETGQFGLPLLPDVYGTSVNYPHNGRVYSVLLAGVFQIFGFGLVQGRAVSLAGALVASCLTFALGRRLYGAWAGLLAGLLLLFSWRMLWTGHVLRPDAWVVAGGLMLVFLYLKWRQGNVRQAATLGLLSVLLVDVYTSGVFYTVTLCGLMLLDAGLAVVRGVDRRAAIVRLTAFGAGAMVGTAYWLVVHLWPDPAMALTLLRTQLAVAQSGGDATLAIWAQVLNRVMFYVSDGFWRYSRLGPVELSYLVLGLMGLLLRRNAADLRWLGVTGIFIGLYVGLFRYVGLYHLVQWLPFLVIALAGTTLGFGGWLKQAGPRRLSKMPAWLWALGLVTPLLGVYAIGTAYLSAVSARQVDYFGYGAQIQALLPPDAHVFAESTWYFVLDVAEFTDDIYVFYALDLPYLDPKVALARAIAERGPVVLVLDEAISYRPNPTEPAAEQMLADFAAEHCVLLGQVVGLAYGLEQGGPLERVTRVYACNGAAGDSPPN